MASGSRLVELVSIISTNTEKIDKFLSTQGFPHPSFDVNGPADFPVPAANFTKSSNQLPRAAALILRPFSVRFRPRGQPPPQIAGNHPVIGDAEHGKIRSGICSHALGHVQQVPDLGPK